MKLEVTQGPPNKGVALDTIKPGEAFVYGGQLYLRLKYDPDHIVELSSGSALANFKGCNPSVVPVSSIEITWVG